MSGRRRHTVGAVASQARGRGLETQAGALRGVYMFLASSDMYDKQACEANWEL